jgi:putative salt-induced outer membrane protein YdiY
VLFRSRYDYRFGDPGFAFASVEQDHDYFGDILSRTVGTIGAGTYLANTSRLVLKTDLGISYTFSRLKIGEDSSTLGYRPSIYLQWKLPLDIRVKDTVTFYGNISKSSDWQARNELMFSREVFKGFQVNGGLTTTWDHGAADGVHARNDTYYFGIGYEF